MKPKQLAVSFMALALCVCAESNVGAADASGWPTNWASQWGTSTNWSAQRSVRRIADVPGISPDVQRLLAKAPNRNDVIGTRVVFAEAGPHSRTWAVVPTAATGTNGGGGGGRRIVAIGTGMNFWDPARGAWAASTPAFVPAGDGFLADRVQHRTHLSANINVMGAVSVTHAGLTLRSTPVAIALTDAASGNSILIATLSDTQGVQVDSNRVVFPNCFSAPGVCADIAYKIELGAIHEDLVIRGRINVAAWGFPEATTRINLISEFFGAPDPEKIIRPLRIESSSAVRQVMAIPDLIDEMLGFNETLFGIGTAYVGVPGGTSLSTVVAKQFVTSADGRKFLVESLECGSASVRAAMLLLPPCSSVVPSAGAFRKASNLQKMFAALRPPPAATEANLRSGQTTLVATAMRERPGFVVDYIQNIGGSLSGTIVFKRDTTYFVASTVHCNGLAVFEAAVFKYPNDT